MKLSHSRRSGRHGFTLIELLVVIAIIAILVSLTSVAVFYALKKATEVQARNDISELEKAMNAMQADFGVQTSRPPSAFVLCESQNDYLNPQAPLVAPVAVYNDSYKYLMQLWPRLNWTNGIDWNGNGKYDKPVLLTGEQCLVFWTGGLQSSANGTNGVLGFSNSPTNPAAPGGTRKGPYFQNFQSSRLVPGANGYFYYKDAWNQAPYLYFSSYESRNNYDKYGGSDCPAYMPGGAYYDGTNTYYKPESFQIISAGANNQFGPGGLWTPANAPSIGAGGADDLTNFYPSRMGVSQ